MWNSMTEDTPNSMPKMWGIPETPPVAHTEISSSYNMYNQILCVHRLVGAYVCTQRFVCSCMHRLVSV